MLTTTLHVVSQTETPHPSKSVINLPQIMVDKLSLNFLPLTRQSPTQRTLQSVCCHLRLVKSCLTCWTAQVLATLTAPGVSLVYSARHLNGRKIHVHCTRGHNE